MKIIEFTRKLLPRLDRQNIAEDLRTTEKENLNIAMPAWDSAAEHFRLLPLKSEDCETFNLLFYRNFNLRRASKGANFIQDVSVRMQNFHTNVLFIQSVLEKYLEKDIIVQGITVRSAFVLRAASNMSFVSRYLLNLLNFIYSAESIAGVKNPEHELQISLAEIKFVRKNFERFVKLYNEYSVEPKDFKKQLDEQPDIFISEETSQAATGFFAGSKHDFLETVGLSGFVGNPIYRIRLAIARWQNDRYESAKAKRQQLDLRLTYLKMKDDGSEDPVVTKEIERLQTRIENYDRYLREVEESVSED